MAYFIGFIVWGLVWGFATKTVIKNKGYDDNWFWWGFFFGFIALIVACAKPENRSRYDYSDSQGSTLSYAASAYAHEVQSKKTFHDGGWTCKCGRVNNSYIGTCACGRTKAEIQKEENEAKEKEVQRQNEAEELNRLNAIKELKSLLDAGAITQDEFDAKKQQLLGL